MSSPSSPTKGAAQLTPQSTTTTATTTTAAATTTTTTPAKTDKGKPKPEKKKGPPTKTQGERWTSSITALLADPEGVEAFRSFLEELEKERDEPGEYTKYIDFYIECEEYKAEFKKLEDKAKDIFETYLSVTAEKEVGTGGKSVAIGDKLEDEGLEGVTIFNEPQIKVKQKLTDGWYIDFCLDIKNKLKL